MGRITHLVLFQFKLGLPTTAVNQMCDRMLSLQHNCFHPTTGKTYIKSAVGGKDNSPEGAQHGLTHGFVVEFENEEDREYYCFEDPVHQEFVKDAGPMLENHTVLDFEPDVF